MTNIQYNSSAIDAGGCVSNGWELVKQNYGLYLGISLLAMVIAGCIPCVSWFLFGPILGGVYYTILRDMNGEPIEFGMMFKGFEKFVPLMVIGLLMVIPEIIGQFLRFGVQIGQIGLDAGRGRGDYDYFQGSAPGPEIAIASGLLIIVAIVAIVMIIFAVVWRLILFFAVPLAMEHDLGPMEAIKLSISAAKSNVGGMLLLFIFEFLVSLLGVLALCIGVFFVIPIIYAANVFAYRQVFPMMQRNFNTSPPPPNAYGSNFGSGM